MMMLLQISPLIVCLVVHVVNCQHHHNSVHATLDNNAACKSYYGGRLPEWTKGECVCPNGHRVDTRSISKHPVCAGVPTTNKRPCICAHVSYPVVARAPRGNVLSINYPDQQQHSCTYVPRCDFPEVVHNCGMEIKEHQCRPADHSKLCQRDQCKCICANGYVRNEEHKCVQPAFCVPPQPLYNNGYQGYQGLQGQHWQPMVQNQFPNIPFSNPYTPITNPFSNQNSFNYPPFNAPQQAQVLSHASWPNGYILPAQHQYIPYGPQPAQSPSFQSRPSYQFGPPSSQYDPYRPYPVQNPSFQFHPTYQTRQPYSQIPNYVPQPQFPRWDRNARAGVIRDETEICGQNEMKTACGKLCERRCDSWGGNPTPGNQCEACHRRNAAQAQPLTCGCAQGFVRLGDNTCGQPTLCARARPAR